MGKGKKLLMETSLEGSAAGDRPILKQHSIDSPTEENIDMLQETQYCEAIQLSSTPTRGYHYSGEASTLPSLSSALLGDPGVFNNSSGASIPAKPHISSLRAMKLDAATDNRAGGGGRVVNIGRLVLETATETASQSTSCTRLRHVCLALTP